MTLDSKNLHVKCLKKLPCLQFLFRKLIALTELPQFLAVHFSRKNFQKLLHMKDEEHRK